MGSLLDDSIVLVTGASSGIGAAMARELAPRVRHLILVARRRDKMQALAAELQAASEAARGPGHLDVHVLGCDLAESADTERLIGELDALLARLGPLDVLINNAGVGDFALFELAPWQRLRRMLTLNCESLLRLTHHFVPGMVRRGRGGILNVSSGWGLAAFAPGFGTYAATKNLVTAFTESLRLDLAGTGVTVTQVCPGPVATEFVSRLDAGDDAEMLPAWAFVSAELVAHAALRGLDAGRAMVVPGLLMKLMAMLLFISPRFMVRLTMLPLAHLVRRRQLLRAKLVAQ